MYKVCEKKRSKSDQKDIENGIPNIEELNSLKDICIKHDAEKDNNISKISLEIGKSQESFNDEIMKQCQDIPKNTPNNLNNEKINSRNKTIQSNTQESNLKNIPVIQNKEIHSEIQKPSAVSNIKNNEALYPNIEASKSVEATVPSLVEVDECLIESLNPFTHEQLQSLYYNPSLENLEEFMSYSDNGGKLKSNKLYHLLEEYRNKKHQHEEVVKDIEVTKKEFTRLQNLYWVFESHHATVTGLCMDNVTVKESVNYETARIDDQIAFQINHILSQITDLTLKKAFSLAFELQISKLHIDQYLSDFFYKRPCLTNFPPNLPPQLLRNRDPILSKLIEELKEDISVLFSCLSTHPTNACIHQQVLSWLTTLVACLLRHSVSEDYLFLLRHTLNLPHQYIKSVLPFIQAPDINYSGEETKFACEAFDLNITQAAMVFNYTRKNIKPKDNVTLDKETSQVPSDDWIVVDSDGEDDGTLDGGVLKLKDIFMIYEQVDLFTPLKFLLINSSEEFRLSEAIYSMSEYHVLKLMAFSYKLVSIVGEAMISCSQSSSSWNNKLGQILKRAIKIVSETWSLFKMCRHNTPKEMSQRIQLQCDLVLLQAVACLLRVPNTRAWQYLTTLPYQSLSSYGLWNLLRLLNVCCWQSNDSPVDLLISTEKCKSLLLGDACIHKFSEKILLMHETDATFILSTLAQVACDRSCEGDGGLGDSGVGDGFGGGRYKSDTEVIEFLVEELFHISLLNTFTRDLYCKLGVTLLQNICIQHHQMYPFLLHLTKKNILSIGSVSYQLFKSLSNYHWLPSESDLNVLQDWLLHCDLHQSANHLARIIVERFDWCHFYENFKEETVDWLAERVADILKRTYKRHIHDNNSSFPLSFSSVLSYPFTLAHNNATEAAKNFLKSLPPPPSSSSSSTSQSDSKLLSDWLWSCVIQLPLHTYTKHQLLQTSQMYSTQNNYKPFYNTSDNFSFSSIEAAMLSKDPFENYLQLQLTEHNESLTHFDDLLTSLVAYKPALLAVLNCSMHAFYQRQYICLALLNLPGFRRCIQTLLTAEDETESIVQQLSSLIANHMDTYKSDRTIFTNVITFWLDVFTTDPSWIYNSTAVSVMDNMIKASACSDACLSISVVFFTLYFKKTDWSQMLFPVQSPTSIFGGITKLFKAKQDNGIYLSESKLIKKYTWLSWVLMKAEGQSCEVDVFDDMVNEMIKNPCISAATAFNIAYARYGAKDATKKDNEMKPTKYLCIYRIIPFIGDLPPSHPVLPLAWFHFFRLFFKRVGKEDSMGHRYFEGGEETALLRVLKRKCDECVVQFKLLLHDEKCPQKTLYYKYIVSLHESIDIWLDERRLHQQNLNIASLPNHYQPQLFETVLQNNVMKWWHYYIDHQALMAECLNMCDSWCSAEVSRTFKTNHAHYMNCINSVKNKSPHDSLNMVLTQTAPSNNVPAPIFQPINSILAYMGDNMLTDLQKLQIMFQADLKYNEEVARSYTQCRSSHDICNMNILSSLQSLYNNVEKETALSVPCVKSSLFSTVAGSCRGPAILRCRHPTKHLNDMIYRQLEGHLHTSYKLFETAIKVPDSSVIVPFLRVRIVVQELINAFETWTNQREVLDENGRSLFYTVLSAVTKTSESCPCSQQHLYSCLNLLGKAFIVNNPSEASKILMAASHNVHNAHLLVNFFNPQSNFTSFPTLYSQVVGMTDIFAESLTQVLLHKFKIKAWLDSTQLDVRNCTFLLDVIFGALSQLGPAPANHLFNLQQLYRDHMVSLCSNHKADLIGYFISKLLSASATGVIPALLWEDLVVVLGFLPAETHENMGVISYSHNSLHLTQDKVVEWINILSLFIDNQIYQFHQNLASPQSNWSFGKKSGQEEIIFKQNCLHTKWALYIPALSKIFYCLNELLCSCVETYISGAEDDQRNSIIDLVMGNKQKMYVAWLRWQGGLKQCSTQYPHLLEHNSLRTMMRSWCCCIQRIDRLFYCKDTLLKESASVLSRFWCFWVNDMGVEEMPEEVVEVFKDCMIVLPWTSLQPSPLCLHAMLKVVDYCRPCIDLVGNIFFLIDWSTTLDHYSKTPSSSFQFLHEIHECVFKLICKLIYQSAIVENTQVTDLAIRDDIFDWKRMISSQTYNVHTASFAEETQHLAHVLSQDRTSKYHRILRFFEEGCHFSTTPSPNPYEQHQSGFDCNFLHQELQSKRMAYLAMITKLITRASYISNQSSPLYIDLENLATTLNNLTTQLESLVSNDDAMCESDTIGLCSQLWSLLNNCNQTASMHFTQVFCDWISGSIFSKLMPPLISSAVRTINSPNHLSLILETFLNAHFSLDVRQTEGNGWGLVQERIQSMTENIINPLMNQALLDGNYFTVYALVLLRLSNGTEEKDLLVMFMDLISSAKPKEENESKLFLWWHQVLLLLTKQLTTSQEDSRSSFVKGILMKLTWHLLKMAEDKSSKGLFGAIGLGVNSLMSLRFRVVASGMAGFLAALLQRCFQDIPDCLPEFKTKPKVTTQQLFQSSSSRLNQMLLNRSYKNYKTQLKLAVELSQDEALMLYDYEKVMSKLIMPLYSNEYHLGMFCD